MPFFTAEPSFARLSLVVSGSLLVSQSALVMAAIPFHDGDSPLIVPRSVSLDRTETDPASPHVEFVADRTMTIDRIKQLQVGDALQLRATPLSLDHVLWCYAVVLFRETDGYHFALLSMGPHLSTERGKHKNISVTRNEPPLLGRPPMRRVTLAFLDAVNVEKRRLTFTYQPQGCKFVADEKLSLQQLQQLASSDARLRARVSFVVPRSYFSLSSIIDLTPPTVSESASRTVETILRGEKPGGCDWAVTVSESDNSDRERTFYVHQEKLARANPMFKCVFESRLAPQDTIVRVPGERRCIIRMWTATDMKVVIPFLYGLPVPLHDSIEHFTGIGQKLSLFNLDRLMDGLFPHWEREICRQAIALKKSPSSASVTVLYRLLTIIWICPYGVMPVAKRVAIDCLANMGHLKEQLWIGPDEEVHRSAEARLVRSHPHFESINDAAIKHRCLVSAVRKFGVDLDQKAKKDDKDEDLAAVLERCKISIS